MKIGTSIESGANWLMAYGVVALLAGLAANLAPAETAAFLKTTLKVGRTDLINGLVFIGLGFASRQFDNSLWLYLGTVALVMDGAAVSFLFQIRTIQTFELHHFIPLLKLLVAFMVLRGGLSSVGTLAAGKGPSVVETASNYTGGIQDSTWGVQAPDLRKHESPNIYGSSNVVTPTDYEKPIQRDCPACGAVMPPAKRFCTSCGNKMA